MINKRWKYDTKYQLCRNSSDSVNIGAVDQKEENVFNNEYTITL